MLLFIVIFVVFLISMRALDYTWCCGFNLICRILLYAYLSQVILLLCWVILVFSHASY